MVDELRHGTGSPQGQGTDTGLENLMTLTVPSDPKYLYVIRSALYPVLVDMGFPRRTARKIILAVDEACSNIIRYAYGGDRAGTITLAVSRQGDRLILRLRDFGRRIDPSKIAPRKLDEVRPGGLGTHFMSAVFDRVEYDTEQGQGTLLILEKQCPEGASAA